MLQLFSNALVNFIYGTCVVQSCSHTQKHNYCIDYTQYITQVIITTIGTSSFQFKSLIFVRPFEIYVKLIKNLSKSQQKYYIIRISSCGCHV